MPAAPGVYDKLPHIPYGMALQLYEQCKCGQLHLGWEDIPRAGHPEENTEENTDRSR